MLPHLGALAVWIGRSTLHGIRVQAGIEMYLLDTHATIRDLEAAGFESKQAEAIVSAIGRADEQVATKADVARLDTSIGSIRPEVGSIRSEVATLRWAVGLNAAVTFAIALRVFGLV